MCALLQMKIEAKVLDVEDEIDPDCGHAFIVPSEFLPEDLPLNRALGGDSFPLNCQEVRARGEDITSQVLNEWTLDMM